MNSKGATRALIIVVILQAGRAGHGDTRPYEVWAIDQSDAETGGGKLYVYDGDALIEDRCRTEATVVDLAAQSAATGHRTIRPHMISFNPQHSHGIISDTVGSSLLIVDANAHLVTGNLPIRAHAAVATPDAQFVIAADIPGNLLTRIRTDYDDEAYQVVDTLDLTPFSAVTKGQPGPVCPIITPDGRYMYTTLNGGGLLLVSIAADRPMGVVDIYDTTEIAAAGCGGVQVGNKVYINSASPDPAAADHIYVFDVRTIGQHPLPGQGPLPTDIVLTDVNDSHGALAASERFVWFFNRDSNDVTVVDVRRDQVRSTFPARLRSDPGLDLAPDIADAAPNGGFAFVSTRGPRPRTANHPIFHNAVGNRPGVAVFQIARAGRWGRVHCLADITSSQVGGVEQSDPHGLAIRRN